ncbi:MAG: hypothetical protein FWC76_04405 [Defluviitaleaceae bacterium]|nr:hypothetical protein [Defluviitaleaceae bacterium]
MEAFREVTALGVRAAASRPYVKVGAVGAACSRPRIEHTIIRLIKILA